MKKSFHFAQSLAKDESVNLWQVQFHRKAIAALLFCQQKYQVAVKRAREDLIEGIRLYQRREYHGNHLQKHGTIRFLQNNLNFWEVADIVTRITCNWNNKLLFLLLYSLKFTTFFNQNELLIWWTKMNTTLSWTVNCGGEWITVPKILYFGSKKKRH